MRKGNSEAALANTGVSGLDELVRGGLPRDSVYLVQGDPGSGKTTLSLQFLLEGARQGETCLYITLSETKNELYKVAESHGWNLDAITIHEQLVSEDILVDEQETTLFHPAEVELGKTIGALLEQVEKVQPSRVVIDSLSEIRLLSQSALMYRKQILALKQFFSKRHITVFFLDDRTPSSEDVQLRSVPHGVIVLDRQVPVYGPTHRRIEVVKLRGVAHRGGYHDFDILTGGLTVFPRLVAAEHAAEFAAGEASSGVAEIDELVGGGLHRGTSTVVIGPAGVGKSSLVTQYTVAAASRGERGAMFVFDENRRTLLERSASLGMPLAQHVEQGTVTVQQINPAELTAGHFAHQIRRAVEEQDARLVVIDSLNGYLNAMPENRFLTLHLHEVLSYLADQGVVTLLVVAQHGFLGHHVATDIEISYLADTAILLRYFEAEGEIRKAISILKKRSGSHEKAIRELTISSTGLAVGPPLRGFYGILSGAPLSQDRRHGHTE